MAVNPEYAAGWTAQDQNRPTISAAHFTPVPVENVPDSTATDTPGVVADLNSLLDALKTGGLMEDDA